MLAEYGFCGAQILFPWTSCQLRSRKFIPLSRLAPFPCLLSSIYGSPRFSEICILWSNLKILSERHNLPWAVMGDFNDVVIRDEKMGCNGICRRRVLEYTNCMD